MRRLQIPDISLHTELWLEDEVEDLAWNDDEYKKLVALLLKQTRWRNEDKDDLRLEINLSLLTGGRSSAHVLKLVFADADDSDIRDILIIRSHLTQSDADKERKNAEILNVNKTDCFANIVEEEAFNFPNRYLVIYQDVAKMVARAEANELCQTLSEFIHSKKPIEAIKHFALNFQEVIRQATVAYGEVEKGHKKIIGSKKYCQGMLSQLPPDLVVSHPFLYDSSGNVLVESQKESLDTAKLISLTDFLSSERNDNWLKFQEKLWLEGSVIMGESKTAYLPFFVKNDTQRVRIWVEIDKNKVAGIESKLDMSEGYELTFFAKEMTFTAQLEKMGFDTQSCLATIDFQTLCEKPYSQLHLDMRHNDLHCGNVLTSGDSFKIIDVGDMKPDLIASDMARLEVSLWFEISKRLSATFSKQEAETIFQNLDNDAIAESPSHVFILSLILQKLKPGFKDGVQHLPAKNEIVLAYVIQILLYQRYCLLDGVDKIPTAFNVFCAYWLNQFRPQSSSKEELTPPQLSETSKEKENMREIQTPPQHPPLEQIGGAVPLDSKFYVERQTDKTFQDMIARRDSIVLLKGARQVGKTSLLARGLDAARQTGMRVLWTDFQKLTDSQLQNLDTFFKAIGQILARQLGLKVKPQDVWQTDYSPHLNFEDFFIDEILAASEKPVLWAIDETDRFFLYPFSSQVFALFRSWHNQRAFEPTNPCSRLTLVITYATEYLLIKDPNQSPFNVGTKLILEDFNLEQVADLNQRYGSPLQHDSELLRFHNLLGGQPYLVRCGLNDIVSRNLTLDEFIRTAEHDDGTFSDHLRRIVLLLNDNEQLSEVIRGVLRGKPCPDYDSFNHLRGAGILKGDSKNDVSFRCEIYESYLHKHLL